MYEIIKGILIIGSIIYISYCDDFYHSYKEDKIKEKYSDVNFDLLETIHKRSYRSGLTTGLIFAFIIALTIL